MTTASLHGKTALVTGGAQRLGAAIAMRLHDAGMRVAIHYRASETEAADLASRLNEQRAGSATVHAGDLLDDDLPARLLGEVTRAHGGLHVLVNNASAFYPTAVGQTTAGHWSDLMASNLKAPFFLSQAATPWLRESRGCIVNMADVYGIRPRSGYAVYCAAKAGLIMLTEALAKELAPEVRVNAIAPGAVLPPPGVASDSVKPVPLHTPLERWGTPDEIAAAALYLVRDATFTTGMVLAVDGGRRISGFG